ncbi:hypothetical protein [Microbacterium kyungheense]|uniref:Uncharacterized protein n=1 Tax=Microbacterium kyungheense TaxID=1263636 RepID=A0A543F162_9MICO|nr:hypothetical protein [Microbacterium kyungheense]TQM27549.1 hypothetical protein FB391_1570 [Microbacterium kyungheense]
MTDAMSRERARAVLEFDVLRRVIVRSVKVAFSGVLGALAVLSASNWVRLLTEAPNISLPGLFEAALPFSHTVDPVLPTLITALLALAVVKASRFAPGFVVGTALLCGFLGSTWAVLSALALLAPHNSDAVLDSLVTGIGLGVVVIAVTVVLTEVLPLSAELREKQLHANLERAESLLARATGRLRLRYPHGVATLVMFAWFSATVLVALTPVLLGLVGVWGPIDYIPALWALTAAFGAAMLTAFVGLTIGCRFWLELSGVRDERVLWAVTWILFTIGIGVVFIAVIAPVARLSEATMVMGLVALSWYLVLVASTLLPLLLPLPKWGWLGQVATSRRVDVLESRRDRLREVSDAAAVDASPESAAGVQPPRKVARWFANLLGRES